MDSFAEQFPVAADMVHVWALRAADFFREFGIDIPPAEWGTDDLDAVVGSMEF